MNDLLSKISSYHLFNYLLPGCLFAAAASKFTDHQFIQQNLVLGLFLYYFYGLVISRLGSLALEPFLRWIRFLSFAEYSDFVSACKEDPKIDMLSETNNMYRTLCSLLVTLVLVWVYSQVELRWTAVRKWYLPLSVLFLLALFLLSYRKQTKYITKRVMANLSR
jgi:hypothetical protein